jgi:hypothetical protein
MVKAVALFKGIKLKKKVVQGQTTRDEVMALWREVRTCESWLNAGVAEPSEVWCFHVCAARE